MYHFIYKTTHKNGKYYVGRHSTDKLDDGYIGSGRWPRSIKDKSTVTREIIEYVDDFHTLIKREGEYLAEHYGQPNCMNGTSDPVGFMPGENNPMNDPEIAKKISGDNHWTHTNPESILKGDTHWMNVNPVAKQRFLDNHPNKDGQNAKLAMKRGTHSCITNNPSTVNAAKGTHHWQNGGSPNFEGKLNKKLVEEGTHNFLGPDHNNKMVAEGKNPWVGPEGNNKRLAEGTHPSQQKATCEHCGKTYSVGMIKRWHGDNCKEKK